MSKVLEGSAVESAFHTLRTNDVMIGLLALSCLLCEYLSAEYICYSCT